VKKMSATGVDLRVPEGIPETELYTSDQGKVSIVDPGTGESFEIIKVANATVRLMNSIGVYRETGRRTGTTYAGYQRVTGEITRAFLNFAEARAVLGSDVKSVSSAGVALFNNLKALLEVDMLKTSFPVRVSPGNNFYPPSVEIEFLINKDSLNAYPVNADGQGYLSSELGPGSEQTLIVKRAKFNNYVIAWDTRGTITSGPLTFMASAFSWGWVEGG